MKNLFKIVALSLVMLAGIGSMNAQTLKQDQDRPEVIAKKEVAQLTDKLDLTGDQQRAVFRAIVSKKSNYAKYVDGQDASQAAANKKKYDNVFAGEMRKVLTAEQFKKWNSLNM